MRAPTWYKEKLTWGRCWIWETIPRWVKRFFPTLHWCSDFDCLAIDRYDPEWEFCHCFGDDKP